jgi:DNA-binding transcriptional regulator YhcF (GntR family)
MNTETRGSNVLDPSRAIFEQIAQSIEASIIDGSLAEESRAPSTNELAMFYRINPATAAKGVNLLVDRGILYKRRGIGMFVASGARDRLHAQRHAEFAERYIDPLLAEADRIGLGPDDLALMIRSRHSRAVPRATQEGLPR